MTCRPLLKLMTILFCLTSFLLSSYSFAILTEDKEKRNSSDQLVPKNIQNIYQNSCQIAEDALSIGAVAESSLYLSAYFKSLLAGSSTATAQKAGWEAVFGSQQLKMSLRYGLGTSLALTSATIALPMIYEMLYPDQGDKANDKRLNEIHRETLGVLNDAIAKVPYALFYMEAYNLAAAPLLNSAMLGAYVGIQNMSSLGLAEAMKVASVVAKVHLSTSMSLATENAIACAPLTVAATTASVVSAYIAMTYVKWAYDHPNELAQSVERAMLEQQGFENAIDFRNETNDISSSEKFMIYLRDHSEIFIQGIEVVTREIESHVAPEVRGFCQGVCKGLTENPCPRITQNLERTANDTMKTADEYRKMFRSYKIRGSLQGGFAQGFCQGVCKGLTENPCPRITQNLERTVNDLKKKTQESPKTSTSSETGIVSKISNYLSSWFSTSSGTPHIVEGRYDRKTELAFEAMENSASSFDNECSQSSPEVTPIIVEGRYDRKTELEFEAMENPGSCVNEQVRTEDSQKYAKRFDDYMEEADNNYR